MTLWFLLACTASGTPEPPVPTLAADSGDTDATGDSGTPEEPWCAESDGDEFATLVGCYGLLDTVAGAGADGSKGVNLWDADMEGGSALDAELSRPHMTMADAAGKLYIADKDAHAIRRVDPDGIITTLAGTGVAGDDGDSPAPGVDSRLDQPNGLYVLADGTVFIHDMGNDKVRQLSPDGELTTLFETLGSDTGRGLWVADDVSRVFVACGDTVQTWTPGGAVEVYASGFLSLGNLVVDPDGLLVVTDRAGHDVTRIHADGEQEVIAGTGSMTGGGGDGDLAVDTALAEVRGIWFHPLGGYFLAAHVGQQVWYVDTDGVIHLFLDGEKDSHTGDGEAFDTPGKKISEPRSITMDSRGRLLITENDVGYVRRIDRAE